MFQETMGGGDIGVQGSDINGHHDGVGRRRSDYMISRIYEGRDWFEMKVDVCCNMFNGGVEGDYNGWPRLLGLWIDDKGCHPCLGLGGD